MSITTKNMTVRGLTQVNGRLLDSFGGAAAAYSLRKLRTGYTGAAVRVRRSSDNTEQDIGFGPYGDLDEASMLSFIGKENLLQYSEQFDNAYWVKEQSSITANAAVAPDLTTTADKLSEDNTLNKHNVYSGNISAINASQTAVFSIYAKAQERSFIQITFSTGSVSGNPRANFNLSNGTLGSVDTSINANISNEGNGWFKCLVSASLSITPVSVIIQTQISSTAARFETYQGVSGYGVYLWGAQFNTGELKTYTQTTTSFRDAMGYVTKWYDQSGNGRDAAQTTAANQPRIVNAGVVEKVNNKPSVYFDGINDSVYTSSGILGSSYSIFTLSYPKALRTSGDTDHSLFSQYNASNGRFISSFTYNGTNQKYRIFEGGGAGVIYGSTSVSINNYYLTTFINNNKSVSGFLNSTSQLTGTFTYSTPPSVANYISTYDGTNGPFNGNISEIVVYPSNQSSSRTSIESSINTYYQIY